MAFEYGCFISYVHARHPLMKEFVDGLAQALESELEPMIGPGRVYIDRERLKPGYRFDPALAQGLCASACMIVVYVPQYVKHEYCLREFRAMQLLEEERRAALNGKLESHQGMIIPVILRGDPGDLLGDVTPQPQYLNFKKFSTATANILRLPSYIDQITKVADYITEIYGLGDGLSNDCGGFEIPPLSGPVPVVSPQGFPGHDGSDFDLEVVEA